ncbi:MAG: glycerol-3-phosphate 1-O-acyltransferase PlsY [Shimia sp.]
MTFLLAILGGYLLGSIPFGIVAAKLFGLGDLRAIGSGNIGATNVLRTGNKPAAAFTLIGDAGKAGAAVLLARWLLGPETAAWAGCAALVGHCFPVWLGFKGGKGVATFLGMLLALSLPVGALTCATWLAVAAVTRYSSLSALVAALSAIVWLALLGPAAALIPVIPTIALVFWLHRENIARLLAGTESKIGAKG